MLSKSIVWWSLALALVPASALIGGHAWLQTTDGKRWLADQIETAASMPDRRLSIGALDGSIPFSPVVTGVYLSDSEGPWLTVERVAIWLNPLALVDWEARFERIEVGPVSVSRRPTASKDQPASSFTWPDLPIPLKIDRLSVAEVVLGGPILGEPARFHIDGSARLGDPTNGLSLDLAIVRTDDTPGSLIAQMRYVPDTQRLTTNLRLNEPEGGMLARRAGLAGLPAVTADLSGDGPLDDWRAELILNGGADLTLAGSMAILAEETGRRVTLVATGRFAALANDALLPLLDTETSLGGSVLVGADHSLGIDRFDLSGAFGEASLTGEIDLAGETADIALTMVPGEPDRFARLTDAASWSGLRLSATLKGPFLEPTLALSIDGASVAYGDVALESLVATVEAAAAAPLADGGSRIDVAADLTIEGMDPGAIVPPGLLEPQIHIAARGSVTPSGRVVADSLTVETPAVRLTGEGAGEGWGVDSATFVGALHVADLARFDTLVDRTLAGAANLKVSADWDGTSSAIRASAEAQRLSSGVAGLDALLGTAPQIALDASFDTDGTVGIESLELSGAGLLLWVSGEIGADALGIDWRLSLADLAAVAPALDGSVAAEGRLTGMPDDPAATARLTLTDAVLAGYPVSEARLDADFTGLVSRPAGNVALEGKVAGLPAQATAELKIDKDDVIRIDGLALKLASLAAEGAVTLDANRMATGQVSVSIRSLADLAPLIGEPLSGTVDASVSLSRDDGRQIVDARISASGAGLPGVVESRHATMKLQLSDLLTQPKAVAQMQADGVRAGDLVLNRAVVTAEGGLNGLDVALDFVAGALDVSTKGRVAVADSETRIDIASLSARHDQIKASLAGPARIALAHDLVQVDGLVLQAEGGRLSIEGHYGESSDMNLTISGVPLELVRLAAPDLELSGRLDGGIRLIGPRAAPRASGDLTATGVTLPAVRKAGFSGMDVKSKIDWDATTLNLNASISGNFGGSLEMSASVSAPPDSATGLPSLNAASSVTGRVSGDARLDVLNDLLAARGDRVDGAVAVDLSLTGRLDDPRIAGSLALTDGSYRGPLTGISLDDVQARLTGDGDRLSITGFSATAPNGGTVRVVVGDWARHCS